MTTTDTTYPDATMRYGATARQVADVFEPAEATDSPVLLPDVRLEVVDEADHAAWGDPASAAWPHLITAVDQI